MEIIVTSILAFISTNLDDIFLLMLFFGDRRFKTPQIFAGQFLGIGALIAISLIASLIGLVIDKSYIGILGLIPIYLGVKGVLKLFLKSKHADEEEKLPATGNRTNILVVAGVTIANGGDNIGIYTPLFASLTSTDISIMILVFFLMTAVWCILARYLTTNPYIARLIHRYGHMVTPFVLILLGLFILYESGAFWLLKTALKI